MIQVLVESATLSAVGAMIGIGIGILGAALVEKFSPMPATISPVWLIVATVLGVGVGVGAGVYPAKRAA